MYNGAKLFHPKLQVHGVIQGIQKLEDGSWFGDFVYFDSKTGKRETITVSQEDFNV